MLPLKIWRLQHGQKYLLRSNIFPDIFYSNSIQKIPEIQLSDQRKEKGTLPWFASNKCRLFAYVFTVGDPKSEWLKRDGSNRVYCFKTRILLSNLNRICPALASYSVIFQLYSNGTVVQHPSLDPPTLADVFMYFWYIYGFYHLTCLCNNFYGLSALVGCWSSVSIRRFIHTFLNVCPFDYTAFAISGKVGIL